MSGPVSAFGSCGPPRRIEPARSTSRSTKSSWMLSSTSSRAPAEQTWPECRKTAVRAKSRATSRSASAKTMLGFLPPSSRATFLTVAAAEAITRRPVTRPPVNETRSTRGSSTSGAAASAPAPRTRLPTPAGSPASSSSRIRMDAGVRRQLARLEHERVAGREAGRDLPGGLEERVVPRARSARRRRAARGPRGSARPRGRCRRPGRRSRPRCRRSAGTPRPRRRRRTRSRPAACRCRIDSAERHLGGVALEQVGHPQQQVAALAGGGRRPRTRVEGVVRRGDGGAGVVGAGLVDLGHEGAVGGAADGAAAAREDALTHAPLT